MSCRGAESPGQRQMEVGVPQGQLEQQRGAASAPLDPAKRLS
jgi:hypothetical protein